MAENQDDLRLLITEAAKRKIPLFILGNGNGHDIKGTSKGIKVGIEELQNAISDGRFYLVDDPRYSVEPIIKELGLYCVDDNGEPVDAYNHTLDEARYAHNYFAKTYGYW